MKPYSNKRSTKGHVHMTSNCPTRKRALRRDKKAARKVDPGQEDEGYGDKGKGLCKGGVLPMTPWLQQAIDANSAGDMDDALDLIYANVDGLILDRRFEELDALFVDPDVAALPTDLLFAVVVASGFNRYSHHRLILNRPALFAAARVAIAKEPESERAELLEWMRNLGMEETP